MKVNKYICLIVTVAIGTFTSVSSAQSGSKTAIAEAVPQAIAEAAPETIVQDASSYVVGDTGGSMVVGEAIIPARPAYETGPEIIGVVTGSGCYEPAPGIQACDCRESSCTRCRPKRQRSACRCKRRGCRGECAVAATPRFQTCEGDFCKLSIKEGKETKTCFTTEQVPVCIPAVRLPWQACCPPSKSRTRLVTKLKTEKSKVDSCSYEWSVEETNNCGSGPVADAAPVQGTVVESTEGEMSEVKPETQSDVKSKVEGAIEENVVPPAPKVNGAFLRSFRKR